MSTRSTISVQIENKIKTIYCHMDGYLEHNGRILFESFNSFDKAKELVDLGDASYIKDSIDSSVFYHRDKGEDLMYEEFFSITPLINRQDYNYIFKDDEWYLILPKGILKKLCEMF